MVRTKDTGVGKGDWVVEIEVAATDDKWRHVKSKFIELCQQLRAGEIIITFAVTEREAEDGEILLPKGLGPKA